MGGGWKPALVNCVLQILETMLNLKLRHTLTDSGGVALLLHAKRMFNCSSGSGPQLAHQDLILFSVTAA